MRSLFKATLAVAVFAAAGAWQSAWAGYVLPAQPITYKVSVTDVSELLGSPGAPGGLGGASSLINQTSSDELTTVFGVAGIQGKGLPAGSPGTSGQNLVGMLGDLKLIGHSSSTGTFHSDIAAGGGLSLAGGDFLFFGALGRNPLLNSVRAGTGGTPGGYFLLTDNPTAFALSSASGEDPNSLSLASGGFKVNTSGGLDSGTLDNYTNASGTALNSTAPNILLAGKLLDLSTISGLVPPGTLSFPGFAPAGTVFVEQVNANVTGTGGFGFLQALSGSSLGSIQQDETFNAANALGSIPFGGKADLAFKVDTTFNLPGGKTEFQGDSSDPVDYVGTPEPSSFALASIGFVSLMLGGFWYRKRALTTSVVA